MTEILNGIRVLEVADYVFVPAAGAVLADWGAEVIKVEHHERGDHMRGQKISAPAERPGFGAFNALMENANRGKRSIGLNLASAAGREVLLALSEACDVFLTSKLAPVRAKLRIDVEDIRARNPHIVYARGTGYGARGPQANSPGFDTTSFWFRAGVAEAASPLDAPQLSVQPGYAFGDLTGSMNIAGGILGALYHRERTGEALTVDVSLLATGMWSMGASISLAAMHGQPIRQPAEGASANALIGAYRTSDGRSVGLCCPQTARYWAEFCKALGRLDLATDPRLSTQAGLDDHATELTKTLAEVFASRTLAEWTESLSGFTGPWTPVQDAYDVGQDPQAWANGYLTDGRSSTGEPFLVVQAPVQYDGQPASTRPAPSFNDSADRLLAELGMSPADVLDLRLSGDLA